LRARRLLVVLLGAAGFLLPAGASGRPAIPTAGLITPVLTGTLGANGWYTTKVTLNWSVDPSALNSNGCDAITFVTDTRDTPRTCSGDFPGGIHVDVTVHIHRDATPPVVTATPSRASDSNGWYNHVLTIGFAGSDATSGIEACSQVPYGGPDDANASASGSCRDLAGNQTTASFALKYDATPPVIKRLEIRAGKRRARVHWLTAKGAQTAQLLRSPGLKGASESVRYTGKKTKYVDGGLTPGREYHYRLVATDAAANQAVKTIDFMARGALLYPAPGDRIGKPPLLMWEAVRGASYYNVILVRGRRIFSAWPVQARLHLARAWTYHGRRYKLRPGTYSWFVWPGYGSLSAGRYGKLLGGSTFKFGGSG
jgi:hypothetical protein